MRTIEWSEEGPAIVLVDQTALPAEYRTLRVRTVDELIAAIRRLAVRGAPALGVAGAFGVVLAARTSSDVAEDVGRLRAARPTAVNLAVGVDRAAAALAAGPEAVLAAARTLRDEEVAASYAMAERGADLITELCGPSPRLLTHCNTGGLATVELGTALGVAITLHRRGALSEVIASETRPLLQGARLTCWELAREGVPHRLAVDGAGPYLMARGEVDAVIVGADRICANGDVLNKVGTYAHSLGAIRAGLPFVVVAPETTVDPAAAFGGEVEVEDRGADEVVGYGSFRIAPAGTAAVNPAFDVTPADLVTALVTNRRVVRYGSGERPC
jgi:methylthioribose-1-phosphate isomerase